MTSSEQTPEHDRPDSAYGWVVVISSLFCMSATSMVVAGFGILYTPYAEAFDTTRAITGWISSLLMCTSGLTVLMTGFLAEKYGCRRVSIIGCLMSSIGILISSFAPNIYVLYLANGLIIGPGFGIIFLCSAVIVQQWFVQKRALAAAIANAGMPFGSVITGPLTTYLYDNMGWRGTLSVYAGIVLNTLVAAALFRPVKQPATASVPAKGSNQECKQESDQTVPNGASKLPMDDIKIVNSGNIHKQTEEDTNNCNKQCCRIIRDTVDISLFVDPLFLVLGIGTFLMNYGLQTLKYHSPSRATNKGVDMTLVQFLPLVHGVSSITGRVLGGAVGSSSYSSIPLMYSGSIIIGGAFTSAVGFTGNNFPLIVACMAPASLMIGVFLGLQATLVTELVGVSRVSRAYGVLYAFVGLASLTAVPFSGWLFDISQDYNVPFLVTGAIQSVGGLMLLLLPYKLHKRRQKELSQAKHSMQISAPPAAELVERDFS